LQDGTEISDHNGNEQIIFDAFKERLGTSHTPQMLFDLDSLIEPVPGLSELSAPFTTEEIDAVVKNMPV
jgi:hypothetical protein